jgi:hypothetical protein
VDILCLDEVLDSGNLPWFNNRSYWNHSLATENNASFKGIAMTNPMVGLIIFGEGHDFTGKLQKITNGKAKDGHYKTHTCQTTYPTGSKRDLPLVLSSEINGCVHVPWGQFLSDSTYNIWVYKMVGMSDEEIFAGLDYSESTYLNMPYAFLAWPWFGWKALVNRVINPLGEKLGLKWLHHDIHTEILHLVFILNDGKNCGMIYMTICPILATRLILRTWLMIIRMYLNCNFKGLME